MGIRKIISRMEDKAGNGVNKLSQLSSSQLQEIEEARNHYFSQIPDPSNDDSIELTNRQLAACSVEIYNAYLSQLKELYVPIDSKLEYDSIFNKNHNIRFINITKWVMDKEENALEKLVNVYESLSNEFCNISLLFNRTKTKTNIYLAITNILNEDNNVNVDSYMQRLTNSLKGNFPGSEFSENIGVGTIDCLNVDVPYSVACASNIPSEKSEKFISQTIEKLLDGIVPNSGQEYTIVLMATPVKDIKERKTRLSELYSALAPYSSWQTSYTYDDTKTIGSSGTVGINLGMNVGQQSGTNQAIANNKGNSFSESDGSNLSYGDTEGTIKTKGSYKGKNASANAGVQFKMSGIISGNVGGSLGVNKGKNISKAKSISKSITQGVSHTLGNTVSNSISHTTGVVNSIGIGGNFGANFARTSNVNVNIGKHEGITQSFTNYNIKHTLELLEQQIKRYEQSSALGMWDFAAYVVGEDYNVVNTVAHSYVALTQGENSYLSSCDIHLWRGDLENEESQQAKCILEYLSGLRHPLFGLNPNVVKEEDSYLVYPAMVNATTNLSSKELAYSLNFPSKSISGLPVIECAEFGRNVLKYKNSNTSNDLFLGNIFHMNHEENTSVYLSKEALTSHVFITGSTGSGKSNTVYQILYEALKQDLHFLVVEPAKGEYKQIFGQFDDVDVYGTNPNLTPLLKLNPFSFNPSIHVLEHIDRLIEIFNVCWPMYAAMPAVLKNAVEKSYEDCGWDLIRSENPYSQDLFPSFKDICRNIKQIIDLSEYDTDNKGAYKGSLLTRLQSLTNGLYGTIFSSDEISEKDLFKKNVIVDLSRVGSMETKSLIMGILVLKLQEYRLSSDAMNQELNHLTVLEEAHNLLKRTSENESSDSNNLLGKSVEMISNIIAEMRTYGEGFIIVDQAPGLLDMSAIRNTNTKIIMRLPDKTDRELVGLSANLNENQINELAKIPLGVGAVYQNEWIQPVLCKVKKARIGSKKYEYLNEKKRDLVDLSMEDRIHIAGLISSCKLVSEMEFKDIQDKVLSSNLDSWTKVLIVQWLQNPPKEPKMTKMAPIMTELFPKVKEAISKSYKDSNDPKEWTLSAQQVLTNYLSMISIQLRNDIIQSCVIDYVYLEKNNINDLKKWTELGGLL